MPVEFQKAMDRTINHAKNTFCFLDDILIVSKGSETEHANLVEAVLKKLDAENLALKLSKCEFFKQEVNWLGHHLSEEGVRPKITKTEAVVNLNPPKSLKQLRSFLGSINHLAKFIPNVASLTEKLRPLLKEENQKKKLKNMKLPVKKFEWGDVHTEAFNAIKGAVANITKVNYYDANRQTRVKCDASHDGLGSTLEQQNDEGLWVPISFASRYLNVQEKKYSTNELELLAVVWAVDRYKHYLLGKTFTIATDHKALTTALDVNQSNKTYQSRLTRWVDRLLPYQFNIVHIPGRDMGIVDYLSRDPFNDPWPESELDEKFVVATINSFHEAFDCWNSRLKDSSSLYRNENVLECSRRNVRKQSSCNGYYSNQNGQNRTKLDRNERKKFPRLQKQLNTTVQQKQITFSSNQPSKQSVSKNCKIKKRPVPEKIKKTDSRIEMSETTNKTYDWWSSSPQDWRNEEREESLMDPKWNRSFSTNNELSGEEEITETVQRTRKIIRGGRKNRDSSDSETRQQQRVKWSLEPEQQRIADQRLLSFWQLIGGENNVQENRELVADTQEVRENLEDELNPTSSKPIASTERKLSEVNVIEVDLTTTEEAESEEEVCSIQPPKGLGKLRLQKQQQVETLDNLAKLFDKNLLAELTTEDTWMDRLRRVIERGDKQGFELMGPYTNPLWSQMAVQDDCILVNNRLAVPVQLRQAVLKRIHRGHPGQEAMLGAAQYLWWPHMNKDIVNLAEECRSCTRYDKQHLERSALTASQMKRRIDQSRENLKIVRKGQLSRDTSPLHKQQITSDRDKERAKALKELLEANARWNYERRDAAKNDIRKLVDETGQLNPDLRKEMIYSWEKGFVEDKVENQCKSPPKTILRKDPLRKSGQALTRPLKGKIASETESTIKTSAGSIYRKSDIAQSKTVLTQEKQRSTSKSPSSEPTKKFKRVSSPELLEELESEDELQGEMEIANEMDPIERFQKSQTIVTSKDTEAGGGLNLAIKRAKPNLAGPKSSEEIITNKPEKSGKEKKGRSKQQQGTNANQTATAVNSEQEQAISKPDSVTVDTKIQSSSTPKTKQRPKLKGIDAHTPLEDIVETFHNRNLAPSDWEKYADQLLKRGVQRVADELRENPQKGSELDTNFEPPQGFSDESSAEESGVRRSSRQTKNKEPKRFGDPIKHSIKEISENLTGRSLLKEALKEYRNQLTEFKDREDRPLELKVRRLERHLFM